MNSYTTVQGDTWDSIAYKLWGSEYLFPLLIEANPKHRKLYIFPGDITLNVPGIDTSIHEERPEWLDEEEEL